MTTNPAKAAGIAPAIHALLDSSGVSLDELADVLRDNPSGHEPESIRRRAGTVADAVEQAKLALAPGTVRTYRSYWRVLVEGVRLPASWDDARIDHYSADLRRIDDELNLGLQIPAELHGCPRDEQGRLIVFDGHGDASLGEVSSFDARVMAKWVRANARATAAEQDRRRVAAGRPVTRKHGKGAEENFIAATRCLFKEAGHAGLVDADHSPAAKIKKPSRRHESSRRAHTDAELRDVWQTYSTTGNDPELDSLIFRLQLETASRQEGCINLRLQHLDEQLQAVWLDQKGDTLEPFPVTKALLRDLKALAASRGATAPEDSVLRQKRRHRHTGEPYPPLTSRRFDKLHERVRAQHQWANLAEWSSHWLRHHVGAQIEAIGGRPCKMRILSHKPNGQTDMYGRATYEQLAWATSVMTGEPHPHAQRPSWIS